MESSRGPLRVQSPEEPKLPKGKQPRRLMDRSKYQPHQSDRETVRRLQQVMKGQLSMAGVKDAIDFIILAMSDRAVDAIAETRTSQVKSSEV